MTTYHYLSAAEWGMTWKRPPVAERLNDPEAFVHHSAGSVHVNDSMSGRELAILHMQRSNIYAQLSRDYSAIGYDDYVIDLFLFGGPDEVWICEARGRFMSAATWDRNDEGEAVCVGGMFHPGASYSVRPRDATLRGTAKAIAKQIREGRTARAADILGHRQNPSHPGATVCPGDWFFPHMPTVELYVADELEPTPDPGPSPDPEPDPPTEDDMPRYFRFEENPIPVFELHNHRLAVWVSADRWAVLEADGAELETIRGDLAGRRLVLVGEIDNGAAKWDAVYDLFGQVISA